MGSFVRDLRGLGHLGRTLVMTFSEFGRRVAENEQQGTDHGTAGPMFLAGGGVKPGVTHGATDELGFHAVENRHYVTDIHATVLHQLGLDTRRLEIPGRKRLEMDMGHVIKYILV